MILGGKLDVGRREDLFFWSSPIFLVETFKQEIAPPTLFQISGHVPEFAILVPILHWHFILRCLTETYLLHHKRSSERF